MSDPEIHLLADFDHDGQLPGGPRPLAAESSRGSDAFAVVPLLPAAHWGVGCSCAGFDVAGVANAVSPAPVRVLLKGISADGFELVVRVEGEPSSAIVLFQRTGDGWTSLGTEGTWSIRITRETHGAEVQLDLGLVATVDRVAAAQAEKWNRHFLLTVSLSSADQPLISADSAPFIIAPFLLASAVDPVEEVLVISNGLSSRFVSALAEIVHKTGAQLRAIDYDEVPNDLWVQDTVEIGRVVVPSSAGPQQVVAILGGLRADHEDVRTQPLDTFMRNYFSEMKAVVIQPGEARANTRWIDWYGNLEVSPPVTDQQGREYPFGRILTGAQQGLSIHPQVLAFLEAQGLQWPPLVVDTSWLSIGHVDEVVNFVPTMDRPGFRVLFPSPSLARCILENLAGDGLADATVFAGKSAETTVDRLLETVAVSEENRCIEARLDETRACLAEGLGIDDGCFIEVPVLFERGLPVIPNMVNGLVCNRHVIAPDPAGPRIDGKDAFANPVAKALAALGLEAHFIDAWQPYHVRAGEVHCGTNTIRLVQGPLWWEVGQREP